MQPQKPADGNPTEIAKPSREESALERADRWREENRLALEAYNEFVQRHGVFSNGERTF